MPSVSESVVIDRSAKEVFNALADPQVQMRYDNEMMRSCEKLTEGPIGKGTRFRGDFKGMGTVEYEYAEFVPDQLIEHAVTMPFGSARHRFEITPEADGARLNQAISVAPNILGTILWPLMMRKMMTGRIRTLNGRVKAYVEGAS